MRLIIFFVATVFSCMMVFSCMVVVGQGNAHAAEVAKPNIIFIMADDMGPGDVRAITPECKFPTPHLDALAKEGMIFTDAHSSSSVCTPTRYGLLTGRYNWRTPLAEGVLWGMNPPLIKPDRLTVGKLLQQQGYYTAAVGKWHLGLGWVLKDGAKIKDPLAKHPIDPWKVDYTQPVTSGPLTAGFDSFFGIPASLDMFPYVYLEDDRCVEVPTVSKAFKRRGPAGKSFEAIDVLPKITERAVKVIHDRAAEAKAGKPFFLYFPLNAPHTPILPTAKWKDKSGISKYCDFTMQVDDTVGQVMAALKEKGLLENTLVIFTADNGCSPAANLPTMAEHGHFPSAQYRGHKADIYEGGHRVPFIAHWPGKIKAGSSNDQLVCLNDLLATCADLLDANIPDNAGEDSISFLRAMTGTGNENAREAVVHHSYNGSFAIRQGKWKLTLCAGSGGWSSPGPKKGGIADLPPRQLFDLEKDPGEKTNLQAQHSEIADRLAEQLREYVARGRSTPGADQKNDREVDPYQAGRKAQEAARKRRN